jgi:alcohol dehydrogenase class IV
VRKAWKFNTAGEIVFGNGAITQLPTLVKRFNLSNIVMITDQGIVRAGLSEKVVGILNQSDIEVFVYDRAVPEPTVESVNNCLEQLKSYQPQLIIALGGGSCIDLAKMVSLFLKHGGCPSDYYGENKVPGPLLPIIAIPTTAGTGSEVSPIAVVTDDKSNLKIGISDNYLRPAIALLDPELTLKLPAYITSCTGMDALSQAIEAYFAKDYRYIDGTEDLIYQGSNPMSDIFAERAIQLIGKNLPIAVHQGNNLEARSNMLLGNLYSALAVSNSGTSLSHALAYPIAEKTKRPHGEIIALLLPYIMKYNSVVYPEKYASIADLLGVSLQNATLREKVQSSIEAVFRLLLVLGLPTKLSMIGVKAEEISEIVEKSIVIERLIKINPKTPIAEEVKSLLKDAI